MKSSVRAGSLLVGVVGALALPAGASAQLDPVGDVVQGVGQTVQQTVDQPVAPADVPAPAREVPAPSKPSAPAPRPSTPSGNQAPAGGASNTASRSSAIAQTAPRSATRPSTGKAHSADRSKAHTSGAGKAHAASTAGAEGLLAQGPDDAPITTAQASSFSAGAGAEPDNGTIGDSRLPFTGGYALPFLALGAGALLAGFALRTSPRLRHARRPAD